MALIIGSTDHRRRIHGHKQRAPDLPHSAWLHSACLEVDGLIGLGGAPDEQRAVGRSGRNATPELLDGIAARNNMKMLGLVSDTYL